MKLDTISKVTIGGLVLTIILAVVGWALALSNKNRAEELLNLAQTVTQERAERIASDELIKAIVDGIPDRILKVEEDQAKEDALISVLMQKFLSSK